MNLARQVPYLCVRGGDGAVSEKRDNRGRPAEALRWESEQDLPAKSRSGSERERKNLSSWKREPDPKVARECLRLAGCAAQTHHCVAHSLNQPTVI